MSANSCIQKVGRRPLRPVRVTQEMLLGQEGRKKERGKEGGRKTETQREELDTD